MVFRQTARNALMARRRKNYWLRVMETATKCGIFRESLRIENPLITGDAQAFLCSAVI
jgi:hypothetical protein